MRPINLQLHNTEISKSCKLSSFSVGFQQSTPSQVTRLAGVYNSTEKEQIFTKSVLHATILLLHVPPRMAIMKHYTVINRTRIRALLI